MAKEPELEPGEYVMEKDNRYRLMLGLLVAWLVLDQISKVMVTAILPFNGSITVIPGFFNLVHVHNRGAAFGFLNNAHTDWQFWLFLAATLLAGGIIFGMARKAKYNGVLFCGFGLILGGAVGNLVDRIRIRAVIDFLDFYVGSWHWPAFNVADVAICLGAVLAGVALWRLTEEEKKDSHVPD